MDKGGTARVHQHMTILLGSCFCDRNDVPIKHRTSLLSQGSSVPWKRGEEERGVDSGVESGHYLGCGGTQLLTLGILGWMEVGRGGGGWGLGTRMSFWLWGLDRIREKFPVKLLTDYVVSLETATVSYKFNRAQGHVQYAPFLPHPLLTLVFFALSNIRFIYTTAPLMYVNWHDVCGCSLK